MISLSVSIWIRKNRNYSDLSKNSVLKFEEELVGRVVASVDEFSTSRKCKKLFVRFYAFRQSRDGYRFLPDKSEIFRMCSSGNLFLVSDPSG